MEINKEKRKISNQIKGASNWISLRHVHAGHDHDHDTKTGNSRVSGTILAFVAWFIVTACGFIGLLLVPLKKYKGPYTLVLQFLTAMGFSSLIGEVAYHLLPHSLFPLGHSNHAHSSVPQNNHEFLKFNVLLLGIVFLYFVEILLRVIPFTRDRKCGCHPGEEVVQALAKIEIPKQVLHNHDEHNHHECVNIEAASQIRKTSAKHRLGAGVPADDLIDNNLQTVIGCPGNDIKIEDVHFPATDDSCSTVKEVKNVVLILLFADMCHHIFDGLAIGAAFSQGSDSAISNGLSLSLAIIFHELPHKVGDVALLVKSGYSEKKATFIVVGTSCVSVIGIIIGCFTTSKAESAIIWINLFTAGMFIYISLVLMMSQMLNAITKPELHIFSLVMAQFSGVILGTLIMFVMAKYVPHGH
ncbi:Zinc transporter ZIP10 [Thelohanellus kitauei]|uniref:Zinc transporter ZIP10 n=1 Tax=Thelohanellus kitauei TaxID=669202 RepID=A0A0C2MJ40_THEKT|nr:Zinc transporter ZIP10 [Thelohanellus kitauei]